MVRIPPLRDRPIDLPLLVGQLLSDLGRPEVRLAPETLVRLEAHRWPGNVRELKNVLACALALLEHGDVLGPDQLRFAASTGDPVAFDRFQLGGQTLADVEQIAIEQTLALTAGDRLHAARLLGISPAILKQKIARFAG